MSDGSDTMKIIKWARKQGACLIKVNGVELTFPLDAHFAPSNATVLPVPHDAEQSIFRNSHHQDDIKAEKALRSALTTDSLNQIEDQEAWFHNNRPPQI